MFIIKVSSHPFVNWWPLLDPGYSCAPCIWVWKFWGFNSELSDEQLFALRTTCLCLTFAFRLVSLSITDLPPPFPNIPRFIWISNCSEHGARIAMFICLCWPHKNSPSRHSISLGSQAHTSNYNKANTWNKHKKHVKYVKPKKIGLKRCYASLKYEHSSRLVLVL